MKEHIKILKGKVRETEHTYTSHGKECRSSKIIDEKKLLFLPYLLSPWSYMDRGRSPHQTHQDTIVQGTVLNKWNMTSRYIMYLVDFFLGNKMNADQTLWHGGQDFHLVMAFWIISPGRPRHFYVFLRGSHGSGVNAEPTSRCVVSWDILGTCVTFVLLSLLWVVKCGLSINFIPDFLLWSWHRSIKWELKIRPEYDCRCDERLKTETEDSTHLGYTGLRG
jgi:hypothetical protein